MCPVREGDTRELEQCSLSFTSDRPRKEQAKVSEEAVEEAVEAVEEGVVGEEEEEGVIMVAGQGAGA